MNLSDLVTSYLPLFTSMLCLSISSLLSFKFDIFLGTQVRTGVQVVMTLDYVL